jgi:hypothetical protein
MWVGSGLAWCAVKSIVTPYAITTDVAVFLSVLYPNRKETLAPNV